MPALWTLLNRYLLPRQGNLLSFALWISVVGVALGIVQLMVVLAVMSGFIELFEKNYTRISGELFVIPRTESKVSENIPASIQSVAGVAAVTPAEFAQGMILKNGVGGVVIEGIERETTALVTPWPEILQAPPRLDLESKDPYWIWMGVQLAKKLNVKVGDTVDLMVAEGQSRRVIPFVVSALTQFGIYDHDLRYVRVDINVLHEIFKKYHLEPRYKVKVAPGTSLPATLELLKEALGKRANVKAWWDIHQNVFKAVNHQKQLLFLILQIIVALAAVNVVNLLMMSTHQRKRDIAILRAMGMRYHQVVQFFVLQGAAVGLVGIGLGTALGLAACSLIEHYQPSLLSETVYNVTRLPMRVRGSDVGLIAALGFFLCVLFSVIPALSAASQKPVNSLRYD